MLSEQRLSVTFGAFSCDIVGYSDPFSILNRVVELFGEIARSNPAFGAGEVAMSDMERAKLAAGLSDQASRIEELADQSAPSGLRYVVSNAEADMLAPAPNEAAEDDTAMEDDVVIAAEADTNTTGGDLELRDTLEAVNAPALVPEEEVVALDIDPSTSAEADAPAEHAEIAAIEEDTLTEALANALAEDATDAPLELREADGVETAVLSEDMQDDLAAPAETAEAAEIEIAGIEIPAIETAGVETADVEIADIEPDPVAAKVEEAPARKPLRLNISPAGVERAAEADEAAPTPEKPVRRVSVTKLPLRPERKTTPEPLTAEPKHTLTPVQKVEPIVTLNTTIGEPEEAAKPSRADRIKAKMDKRDADDDGENFLFADVAAPAPAAETDQESKIEAAEAPLTFGDPSPEARETETLETEATPKPRRSLASLLGFGKKPAAEPKPAVDIQTPEAASVSDVSDMSNGFDRLRETVAAAMPAVDEPLIPSRKEVVERPSISEAIDYDDETSPTAFARRVGANTLQDLLEASAVYMDIVEGKSRFSRRDVMQALHQIDADKDYTQEARLKSFRKLLTTGSLVRVDDGMFTVSQATRYGYESQLQAS